MSMADQASIYLLLQREGRTSFSAMFLNVAFIKAFRTDNEGMLTKVLRPMHMESNYGGNIVVIS